MLRRVSGPGGRSESVKLLELVQGHRPGAGSGRAPTWQEAEDEITASTPPEQPQRAALKTALIPFLDQKRLALDLMAEAVQENDPEKNEWAQEVYNKNMIRAAEIKELIEQTYVR